MTHADEARDLLQPLQALAGKDAAFDLEIVQAHASLELAEQMRIANVIALGTLGEHTILNEQVSEDAAESLVEFKKHDAGGYFQLRPEIAAALKIGNQA